MTKEELLHLYRQMALIRRFEETAEEMYGKRKIGGFLHVYIGEEAVAVGATAALHHDDYVVSHYREHGHAIAKGCDPKRIMAELFGKATGVCKGKGGSMHLFCSHHYMMGGYAIVSGGMPIATGLALASQYKGDGRVTVNFFGDGAVDEGEFHEALDLAALWKLPIVFLCENNFYAMGTALQRTSPVKDVHLRAQGYGMPGLEVDGMDVVAVREATAEAVARARAGEGPSLLEAKTYRFRGHSMADPAVYRQKDEEAIWKARDPILRLRSALLGDKVCEEPELKAIDEEVVATVAEAVQFAEESPLLPVSEMTDDIYAGTGGIHRG